MELKPGYKQTEVGVIPEDWEVTTTRRIRFCVHTVRSATPMPTVVNAGSNDHRGASIVATEFEHSNTCSIDDVSIRNGLHDDSVIEKVTVFTNGMKIVRAVAFVEAR